MNRSRPAAEPAPPATPSACPVTIACGSHVVDLVLPSSVPVGDLLAGVIRSVTPDPPGETVGEWALARLDATLLLPGETLDQAGILVGAVLRLTDISAVHEHPADTARDRIEDIVELHGQFWDRQASARLMLWAAVVTGCLLLYPAITAGVPMPAAGVVAVLFAGLAALADRRGEGLCPTPLLITSAAWAATAGTAGLRWWTTGTAAEPALTVMVAAGCGLLVAGWTAVFRPFAVATAAGFGVLVAGSGMTVVAVTAGAPLVDSAAAVAVLGALLLGALPRSVLVLSGVAGEPVAGPGFDARLIAAQRLLTGCLVGVTAGVLLGAASAALTGEPRAMILGFGVACLLLLRARAFAQVQHTIGPRVAGLLLLAVAALGCCRSDPTLRVPMILAAAVAVPVAAAASWSVSRNVSPVAAARTARTLDVMERLVVVAVLLLAAADLGVADWAVSVATR